MLNGIAEIILKSKIDRDNKTRQKKYLPWDKIEKVGLIIRKNEKLNKAVIDKYLEKSGKYVEVFLVEPESKEPSYADWTCFVKKDKSLFKLPRKNKINALHGKHFDIVINTCPTDDLFAVSLTSALKATLKCGGSSRFAETDLIIVKSEPFDLVKYLNDVLKYLKMIKG